MFEDAKHITDMMHAERTATGELRFKAKQKFNRELATRASLVALGFKRADAVGALQRLRDAMDANQTQFFAYEGIVTDQRETPDHRIRIKAAQAVLDMVPGVKAPQELLRPTGEIQLEVVTVAADGTKTAVRVSA